MGMGIPQQPRQPPGTSQGGQFGPTRSPEPGNIGLSEPEPTTPGEAFRAALRVDEEVQFTIGEANGSGTTSLAELLETVDGSADMVSVTNAMSEALKRELGLANLEVATELTGDLEHWRLSYRTTDAQTGLRISSGEFSEFELFPCDSAEYGDFEDRLVASYEATIPKASEFAEGAQRLMRRS